MTASHSRLALSTMASSTGCDVGRRGGDHLEHVGGGGLLLQGSDRSSRACLHLVEQADVLDRDHRLVGEGGDEVDLLLRERFDALARQHDHADRFVLAQQRHAERRALAGQRGRFMQRVFGISHDIEYLDRAPLEHGAAGDRAAVDGERVVREEVDIGLGIADGGARRGTRRPRGA